MKNKTKIGNLIEYLQQNSRVGWGMVHIGWFSDGEFIEGWRINIDNQRVENIELYDALIKAKLFLQAKEPKKE